MTKNMDIRLIRLAKWQIPKSRSVLTFCEKNTYLSIGYFDMIDVKEVNYDGAGGTSAP